MRLDSRPMVDSLSRHDIIIPETWAQYGSNQFGSDGIELNSNEYDRNIGSNEFGSDGIERVANLNKYIR